MTSIYKPTDRDATFLAANAKQLGDESNRHNAIVEAYEAEKMLTAALVDALKGIIEDAETLDVERHPAKIMGDLMSIASDARAAIARATQEPK